MQIKNLTAIHKKDSRKLLEALSFVLNPGDKMAVIGEEGNGKSTLLKLIYEPGLAENYVEYQGEIIKQGLSLGYLAQELSSGEKELTIWEYMCENPCFYQQTPKELSRIADKLGLPGDVFYGQE